MSNGMRSSSFRSGSAARARIGGNAGYRRGAREQRQGGDLTSSQTFALVRGGSGGLRGLDVEDLRRDRRAAGEVAVRDQRHERVDLVLARRERALPSAGAREPALHRLTRSPVLAVREVPELGGV